MKDSSLQSDAEREADPKKELPGPPRRPLSVTIASWVLIYWSVLVLTVMVTVEVFAFFDSKSTKQVVRLGPLLGAVSGMLIILSFGIGLLRGARLARLLLLRVGPAVVVFVSLTEFNGGVFAAIIYVIYAVILNRRSARLYFIKGGL